MLQESTAGGEDFPRSGGPVQVEYRNRAFLFQNHAVHGFLRHTWTLRNQLQKSVSVSRKLCKTADRLTFQPSSSLEITDQQTSWAPSSALVRLWQWLSAMPGRELACHLTCEGPRGCQLALGSSVLLARTREPCCLRQDEETLETASVVLLLRIPCSYVRSAFISEVSCCAVTAV